MAEASATVVDRGLRVRDYSVSYATGRGPLQVLEGVDLAVRPGEVLGLVGESGSGKSTLAYAVMRTLRAPVAAESGDIALGGVPLRGLDEHRLSSIRGNRIAMVFQHPGASLNPTLTLGEHFRQVLARHRDVAPGDTARETERLLAMVGLPDPSLMARKYPHEVSGGENQRAVIALAFACEPELILFELGAGAGGGARRAPGAAVGRHTEPDRKARRLSVRVTLSASYRHDLPAGAPSGSSRRRGPRHRLPSRRRGAGARAADLADQGWGWKEWEGKPVGRITPSANPTYC